LVSFPFDPALCRLSTWLTLRRQSFFTFPPPRKFPKGPVARHSHGLSLGCRRAFFFFLLLTFLFVEFPAFWFWITANFLVFFSFHFPELNEFPSFLSGDKLRVFKGAFPNRSPLAFPRIHIMAFLLSLVAPGLGAGASPNRPPIDILLSSHE